jgi:hypothetical protein
MKIGKARKIKREEGKGAEENIYKENIQGSIKERNQQQTVLALSHNGCKYSLLSPCSQKWNSFQKSRHSAHLQYHCFLWILCLYRPVRDSYLTSPAHRDGCCSERGFSSFRETNTT